MTSISSLSLMTQSILQIQNVQSQLSDLSKQLATGKKSLDLSTYSLTDANNILDLNSAITKKQSYIDSINTVSPELQIYNSALSSMSTTANDAVTLINQATDPTQAASTSMGTQIQGFLQQMGYYLNQQSNNGYIFNGARGGTQPVVSDLTSLPDPTVTSPDVSTLPDYDTQSPGTTQQITDAYTKASVKIDDGFSVTYGISSDDPTFQNLIIGMRWALAASKTSDPNTFNTDMGNARSMIISGLTQLQNLQAQVANNVAQMNATKDLHNSFISTAQGQLNDIQGADSANVATQISFAQAQLQASYSVTAKISSLSLVNYLPT